MKRWVCPSCGDGQLAPERPRAEDARQYCLPCTAKSPSHRLVRRTCPSLDRMRMLRNEGAKRNQRIVREAARAAELRDWTRAGLDLRAVARRCWSALLPALREREATRRLTDSTNPPVLLLMPPILHQGSRYPRGTLASKHAVTLRVVPEDDAAYVWAHVLYALARAAIDDRDYTRAVVSRASTALWDIGLPGQVGWVNFLPRALRARWADPALAERDRVRGIGPAA